MFSSWLKLLNAFLACGSLSCDATAIDTAALAPPPFVAAQTVIVTDMCIAPGHAPAARMN